MALPQEREPPMTEGIPLKDIAGAVIEKRKESKFPYADNLVHIRDLGFNEGVCAQAEVCLTLLRDKLATLILRRPYVESKEASYKLADAIISNLASLIVVVKEKKG